MKPMLLLDVTLPDGSGFSLCRQVRSLDSEGDDYIPKPFRLGELCSRIRALLRRSGTETRPDPNLLLCGPLTLERAGCRATLESRLLSLTATEYRLLTVRGFGYLWKEDRP